MDVYVAMILTALVQNPKSKVADFMPQWRPAPPIDYAAVYEATMKAYGKTP